MKHLFRKLLVRLQSQSQKQRLFGINGSFPKQQHPLYRPKRLRNPYSLIFGIPQTHYLWLSGHTFRLGLGLGRLVFRAMGWGLGFRVQLWVGVLGVPGPQSPIGRVLVFSFWVFPKTRRPLKGGYRGYVGVSGFYSLGFISVWPEES